MTDIVLAEKKRGKTPPAFRGNRGVVNPEWLLWVLTQVSSQDGLDMQLRTVVDYAREAVGATRGSLFMFDDSTNELYTRIADGMYRREIRISSEAGVAGSVYTTGQPSIVLDVSKDPRFLAEVDKETGFVTTDMLAVPVRTLRGNVIGVAQMLNKMEGQFDKRDLVLMEALTQNVAIVLHGSTQLEASVMRRKQESEMLDVVSEASTEIHLGPLLKTTWVLPVRCFPPAKPSIFPTLMQICALTRRLTAKPVSLHAPYCAYRWSTKRAKSLA